MNYYYVTGSSKGLGKAICELLLQSTDNTVIGISRSCTIKNERYKHVSVDLSDIDSVRDFSFTEHRDAKRIVLINNAGAIGEINTVGKLDSNAIAPLYNLGIVAPTVLCNLFVTAYESSDCERIIINVSSGAGKNAIGSWSIYCAVKAGLDMFTSVMGEEQKNKLNPITVLAVAPGIVDTNMQKEIRSSNPKNFSRYASFVEYYNTGQLATAEEVAAKYLHIIENVNSFNNPIISVRDLD